MQYLNPPTWILACLAALVAAVPTARAGPIVANSVTEFSGVQGQDNWLYGYYPGGFTPTNFYDGAWTTSQWTTNVDIDRSLNVGMATPLNVAFGFGAFGTTYHWDPAVPTLGAAFATAPDTFALDLKGKQLLGPQSTFAADGGPGPIVILAAPTAADTDGGPKAKTLVTSPFNDPGFYLGNATVVP